MYEHLIRLRGAWDWHPGAGGPGRVALPTRWAADVRSPFRLSRRFHRPPIDPDRETLALRMESVAGLGVVRLNGRELARPAGGVSDLTLTLEGSLPGTNLLELEVDPAAWGEAGLGDSPWGRIALVVVST